MSSRLPKMEARHLPTQPTLHLRGRHVTWALPISSIHVNIRRVRLKKEVLGHLGGSVSLASAFISGKDLGVLGLALHQPPHSVGNQPVSPLFPHAHTLALSLR